MKHISILIPGYGGGRMKKIEIKRELSSDTKISTVTLNGNIYALHALDGELIITDYDFYSVIYGILNMGLVISPIK